MVVRPRYVATLTAHAVSATTFYQLVDLSNTTGYPHNTAGELHVLGAFISAEIKTDGQYDIKLGVCTENDGTDGSVKHFLEIESETVDNPTDSTGKLHASYDFTLGGANPDGINCLITGGATKFVSNVTTANDAGLSNLASLTSPIGTGSPAAGDVILEIEEAGGTGTIDASITLIYEVA